MKPARLIILAVAVVAAGMMRRAGFMIDPRATQ